MKKHSTLSLILLAGAACMLSLSSCGKSKQTATIEPGSYTLLVYMCGSSLETKKGAATKNIADMLSVEFPKNTTVIIQTGGAEKWRDYQIPSDKSCRYVVQDKQLIKKESTSLVNMGEADELASFLTYGQRNYPAEQMGLILWNHGGGSAAGVCIDEMNQNDLLTLSEISSALTRAALPNKLSFVGFDACLMANYEAALTLAPFADKMLASEELEPSRGWDYSSLLLNLNDLSKVLTGYAERNKQSDYYTLSLIDLTKIDKISTFFHRVIEKASSGNKNLLSRAVFYALQFGSSSVERGGSDLYDLGGTAKALGIEYDLSDCISCVSGAARTNATGLSFYFPLTTGQTKDAYLDQEFDLFYNSFLKKYFTNPISSITFQNRGIETDNKLSFSIFPESEEAVCTVQYILYQAASDTIPKDKKEMVRIGYDTDVIKTGNTYTVNFAGNWVFWNDYLLCCQVVKDFDDYTVYTAPVSINDAVCSQQFVFDKTTRLLQMSGYSSSVERTDRLSDLMEGDRIVLLHSNPASTSSYDEYETGGSFVYSDESPINIKRLEDGIYIYQAQIIDIYWEKHMSDAAIIRMKDGTAELLQILPYDSNLLTQE